MARREPWPGEAGPDEPDEAGRAELPAASALPAEPGGGDNVRAGPRRPCQAGRRPAKESETMKVVGQGCSKGIE